MAHPASAPAGSAANWPIVTLTSDITSTLDEAAATINQNGSAADAITRAEAGAGAGVGELATVGAVRGW